MHFNSKRRSRRCIQDRSHNGHGNTVNQSREERFDDAATKRASLDVDREDTAPFSVSDYFWQRAESGQRSRLKMLMTNDAPPLVAPYHVNVAYDGGSRSRLGIHDGTVSCLRSGWLVAASELSPQGKPWYLLRYVLGHPRRCRIARPSCSLFSDRSPRASSHGESGEPSKERRGRLAVVPFPRGACLVASRESFHVRGVAAFCRVSVRPSACTKDTSSRSRQLIRARTLSQ